MDCLPGTAKLLPLKDDVGNKDRESNTRKHNGCADGVSKGIPAGHPSNHTHLKKNQCNRKASRHPLAVLLDLSFPDKSKCDARRDHQQGGVHADGDAEFP
jgi:hypothetical protein